MSRRKFNPDGNVYIQRATIWRKSLDKALKKAGIEATVCFGNSSTQVIVVVHDSSLKRKVKAVIEDLKKEFVKNDIS